MAALTLQLNVAAVETLPATAGLRRRVVMPAGHPHSLLRVFSASGNVYVERVDAADESAAGTPDETVLEGSTRFLAMGRGELAVSGDNNSQSIEIEAVEANPYTDDRRQLEPSAYVLQLGDVTATSDVNSIATATQMPDGVISIDVANPTAGSHFPTGGSALFEFPLVDLFGRVRSVMSWSDQILVPLLTVYGVLPDDVSVTCGIYGDASPGAGSGAGFGVCMQGNSGNVAAIQYAPAGAWAQALATADADVRKVRGAFGRQSPNVARVWWAQGMSAANVGLQLAGTGAVLQTLSPDVDRAFLSIGWTAGTGSPGTIRVRPSVILATTDDLFTLMGA